MSPGWGALARQGDRRSYHSRTAKDGERGGGGGDMQFRTGLCDLRGVIVLYVARWLVLSADATRPGLRVEAAPLAAVLAVD